MRSTLALLLLLATPATAEVTLSLAPVTVAPGASTATVCVSLDSGDDLVAGTQNDLVWDGECATLPSARSCGAAETHGKDLSGRIIGDFTFRGLILSLSDVNPIPDGELYCCDFDISLDSGECCEIEVTNPGASNPQGGALEVSSAGAEICAGPVPEISFTPTLLVATLTPTPTQQQTTVPTGGATVSATPSRSLTPTHTPTTGILPNDEDDGCQVGPANGGIAAWPLAIAAVIAVLRRRR